VPVIASVFILYLSKNVEYEGIHGMWHAWQSSSKRGPSSSGAVVVASRFNKKHESATLLFRIRYLSASTTIAPLGML